MQTDWGFTEPTIPPFEIMYIAEFCKSPCLKYLFSQLLQIQIKFIFHVSVDVGYVYRFF